MQPLDGQWVLGTAVDVCLARTHRIPTDHHPFDHRVGVALQDGAIHERSRVTFVGIADDVLDVASSPGSEFPL